MESGTHRLKPDGYRKLKRHQKAKICFQFLEKTCSNLLQVKRCMETEGRCSLAWTAASVKGIRNISVLPSFSCEVECFPSFLCQGNERGGKKQKWTPILPLSFTYKERLVSE